MAVTQQELKAQLDPMLTELARRRRITKDNARYYDGDPPFPDAVVRAKMTTAYRTLMPMASAPWGSLVVDSVQDRLEVAGIRADKDTDATEVWDVWQRNEMDAESKLGQNAALIDGRAFAVVWPGDGGQPEITLECADQVVVMYQDGSRRRRIAAMRHWIDEEPAVQHVTLYRPDGIYKFSESRDQMRSTGRFRFGETWWERRQVANESWPLPNPLGEVPAVEVAVNRRLRPGKFPYARGEFEHCTGLLDRINLLTFLGLVVALWMGFPLRGVLGQKILRDDEGEPIAPFDAAADTVFQFESPDATIAEYKAADRRNLSVFAELAQLAYITKTPAHYFPHESLSNISADAIRGLEGGMHAKVTGHKASLGGGWLEVGRLTGRILDSPVVLPPTASIIWKDHESRSMGERADAATKVASLGFPWPVIAEKFLNFTQDEIVRAGALMKLVEAAQQPPPSDA